LPVRRSLRPDRRENRDFNASLDSGLAEVARSGVDGIEPIVNTPEDIDQLGPLLAKHGLAMRDDATKTTFMRKAGR